MESELNITLSVEDVSDLDRLGTFISSILTTLDEFPSEDTSVPRPRRVDVTFSDTEEAFAINFLRDAADRALAAGLSGAALLEALSP